jgi:hypothetical protein
MVFCLLEDGKGTNSVDSLIKNGTSSGTGEGYQLSEETDKAFHFPVDGKGTNSVEPLVKTVLSSGRWKMYQLCEL